MAYSSARHLAHNDAVSFFTDKLDAAGRNALENHLSWCSSCRSHLNEVWLDLEEARFNAEVAALSGGPPPGMQTKVDYCIETIVSLRELVKHWERKTAIN